MTISELNQDVLKTIDELKKRFINDMNPSMYENTNVFYRFLKARNFNIEEAESMLRKHLEWRKEMKVDTILTEKIMPDELQPYINAALIGFDKGHAPVAYMPFGNFDFKGMRYSLKFRDRAKNMIKLTEGVIDQVEKQSVKLNEMIEGFVMIVDMKNFSIFDATDKQTIRSSIYLVKMFQDNYPERLKSLVLINVSAYFYLIFSIVKTFIAASVLKKYEIYTTEDVWKPVLLEKIDADVLPAFLGGNRTDPDGNPLCKTFVSQGGVIPQRFHVCKSKHSLADDKDVKKLVIYRASFSEIELDVQEPGSVIEWEFETKSRDISFGLFLKEEIEGKEKNTEILPLSRTDTEEFAETGMYKCEKAGKYFLLFDNSYSWVRSKEIYYKATVITPKEHVEEMASL